MIIPFSELPGHEVTFSGINVIRQRPAYRSLRIDGRRCNGFICVTRGSCIYRSSDGDFSLEPGGVAYVPLGSFHSLEIEREGIEFYRVDFTVRSGNEVVLFSELPQKITDSMPGECFDLLGKLCDDCDIAENYLLKTERLCTLFRLLASAGRGAEKSRLEPALLYIHEHLTEKIDCRALAAMCFMSTSQFYSIFGEKTGTTPLGFRDRLLVQRARQMLEYDGVSVSEAASALGFESTPYFSRFIKKHTGKSPSQLLAGSGKPYADF